MESLGEGQAASPNAEDDAILRLDLVKPLGYLRAKGFVHGFILYVIYVYNISRGLKSVNVQAWICTPYLHRTHLNNGQGNTLHLPL